MSVGKAQCLSCGSKQTITARGNIAAHKHKGKDCPGSGAEAVVVVMGRRRGR